MAPELCAAEYPSGEITSSVRYRKSGPILSSATKTTILQYASAVRVLDCPNLARSFEKQQGWRDQPQYGIAIGYHYLGGEANTPWPPVAGITNTWASPQKATDHPALVLVADSWPQ